MTVTCWCITLALCITSVLSAHNVSNIRVFPAANHSIAGVIQISCLDEQNRPLYALNASQARQLCWSIGLCIASGSQVKEALSRGFETCRFGWIDEHVAVIPRIRPLAKCGKNQVGLVPWPAPVTYLFDVFCFNESDAREQMKNTTTAGPFKSEADQNLTTQDDPLGSTWITQSTSPTTSSNIPDLGEPARLLSPARDGKVVLISCTCGLLLTFVAILVYLKWRRHTSFSPSKKQQQKYTKTNELKSIEDIVETERIPQDDQREEAGNERNDTT